MGIRRGYAKEKSKYRDFAERVFRVVFGLFIFAAGNYLTILGNIGLGTLIAMCGMGLAMQIVFTIFRFDPRIINQLDLIQTYKSLLRN